MTKKIPNKRTKATTAMMNQLSFENEAKADFIFLVMSLKSVAVYSLPSTWTLKFPFLTCKINWYKLSQYDCVYVQDSYKAGPQFF